MPSRLPVTAGLVANLQESSKESIRAQVLPSATAVTKERLVSMSHGVMRAEDQDSSDSDCHDSDYMANPSRWENNAARKQLDMQWHYTCGPLRVSNYTGKHHWNRLHSSNVAAIPQPGGGIHVMTSNIVHRSDKELEAQAAKIGISKRALQQSRGLPPIPPNHPSTPMMRKYLADTTMPPVPHRTSSVVTDGSSAFSRTTVAVSKAPSLVGTAIGVRSGDGTRSNVSAASRESKRSAVSTIRSDLERERTQQRDLAAELREAAQRLAKIEELLHQ